MNTVLKKKIKGWENYEITSDGRVFSLNFKRTGKKKEMKLSIGNPGYMRVNLRKPGIAKTFRIHKLVSDTFLPNPKNKKFINHKDGNKINNHIKNLEWVTRSENEKHAFKIGLKSHKGENNNQTQLTGKDVKKIRSLASTTKHKHIAKMFNMTLNGIRGIIYRRNWKHIK